jgi:hypothetical protein
MPDEQVVVKEFSRTSNDGRYGYQSGQKTGLESEQDLGLCEPSQDVVDVPQGIQPRSPVWLHIRVSALCSTKVYLILQGLICDAGNVT